MSKPIISWSEFSAAIADEDEERFVRSDLERFDYDPPKERCALVSWCSATVNDFGETVAPFWRVIMAGDAKRWNALHEWGVLNFGEPPWRGSQVVRVVGRLGSLERAVAALAPPGPEFVYEFDWKAPAVPVPVVARPAGVVVAPSRPSAAGVERRFRRAVKPDRKPPDQGELF